MGSTFTFYLLRLFAGGATPDRTFCFHCCGGLKERVDTDEPFKDTLRGFPIVYISDILRGGISHSHRTEGFNCKFL